MTSTRAQDVYHLEPGRSMTTIGRDPSNDIVIDDPLVSRNHAQVEVIDEDAGLWRLIDLSSTNGTYLNDRPIRSDIVVTRDDEIGIGRAYLYVPGATRPRGDAGIRIDANGLTRRIGRLCLRHGKTLLDHVSLSILPCEFVAILGTSGAGKSTLLRALSGAAPASEGTVCLNDHDFYAQPGRYRGLIGYGPQEIVLHDELPVRRALQYAARLRLDPSMPAAERHKRIATVLDRAKLSDRACVRVGNLSGGQRKRVNIAYELLADPRILYLDEPTSGLDPGMDEEIMGELRRLAHEEQKTVVVVTHTTEHIEFCDLIVFVAPGGRLVYYGPPADALALFGLEPMQYSGIYTAVTRNPRKAEELYQTSSAYRTYTSDRRTAQPAASVPPPSHRPVRIPLRRYASEWRQWAILTQRTAEVMLRDWRNVLFLACQPIVVGILLDLLTKPDDYTPSQAINTQQVLLILTITAVLFSTLNAARAIVRERAIYLRERLATLNIRAYVGSKVAVLGVGSSVQMLLLFGISAWKTPHLPATSPIGPAPLAFYITLLLASMAGSAAGLLISSLFSSSDRAMTWAIVFPIVQLLFSGVAFPIPQGGPVAVIAHLCVSYWCMQALGRIVNLTQLAGQQPLNGTYSPRAAPDIASDWAALVLFSVVFLAVTALSLRYRDR